MKTVTRISAQWEVRKRQAGDFAVYNDKGQFKGYAATRQLGEDLIVTLQKQQRAARQTAEEVSA